MERECCPHCKRPFNHVLRCVKCGHEFEITPKHAAWYARKEMDLPKRCEACRAERRSHGGER